MPISTTLPALVKRFATPAVVTIAFLSVLWLLLFRQLSGEWSVNDQYSYGWFVPLFAAILFWLRWEDRPKRSDEWQVTSDELSKAQSQIADRKLQIGAAVVALLLLFPIRLFEVANPDWRPLSWTHTAIVATLTLLLVWHAGGMSWLRHFAFPILFVFVAVPWITPFEVPIVQGLMRVVAGIATEAVSLFGIPAQLEGNLIRINRGVVGVNEACSGVRSLQTSLMIGLLFGELKRLSILHRFALVGAAVGIAFIGNCGRAFFLVWIAATKNIAAVEGWHDFAGYSILAAVFVGTLLLARWLAKKGESRMERGASDIEGKAVRVTVSEEGSERVSKANVEEEETDREQRTEVGDHRTSFLLPNFNFLISALIWIVLIEIGVAIWYRAHERNFVKTTRWDVQWPQGTENFHEVKIDESVQRILRFDEGQSASWTSPGFATLDLATSFTARPPTCSLFFFRWKPGKNSALLANLHRPDVCLPAVGWKQVEDSGVRYYAVNETLALPFRHFEFRHGASGSPAPQVAHAFYCLWEDRALISQQPQMATSASAWTRSERLRAVMEGRRHLGQQVMEFVIQTRGPIESQQAEARFAQVLPELIKVESRK